MLLSLTGSKTLFAGSSCNDVVVGKGLGWVKTIEYVSCLYKTMRGEIEYFTLQKFCVHKLQHLHMHTLCCGWFSYGILASLHFNNHRSTEVIVYRN